jgi:hypothetical protein
MMVCKRSYIRDDAVDESFDEFIEKGYIAEAGNSPDGEPICRLTDKAIEQDRYQTELRKALGVGGGV